MLKEAELINRMRYCRNLLVAVVLPICLAGCALSSVFVPYPGQAEQYQAAIERNQMESALDRLEKYRNKADKILYLLERGRIAQLQGKTEASLGDFSQVFDAMDDIEARATLSASYSAAQGVALATNDNAIPYQGAAYERIFAHQFQAYNYLAKNNAEGALVEVRRANEYQNVALEKHHRKIAKAEKKARKNELAINPDDYDHRLFAMSEAVGKVKNSFQNAYTFYLSAVIYESSGKFNDAYIDYKKALEIYPNNRSVQKTVLRLAKQLGMNQDYKAMRKQWKLEAGKLKEGSGEVVVIFEQGFVPKKKEISLPIPTPASLHAVAFPVYQRDWEPYSPLSVSAQGALLGETAAIVDVYSLAARALKEKMLAMILRQALRIGVKNELQDTAEEKGGQLAGFATLIYNIISERADLRSWLTLPQNAQVARYALPAGEHQLKLEYGFNSEVVVATIKPGGITIIRVVGVGSQLLHQQYIL